MSCFLLTLSFFAFLSCSEQNSTRIIEKPQEKYFQGIPEDITIDKFVENSMVKIKDLHPSIYFELVNLLFENEHFDESAFVFLIGNNSYKLFNHSNPNFTKADKQDFDMVGFSYGFENYDYLQSNLENYSKVVLRCHDWYSKQPPHYFNNEKEKAFYSIQLEKLERLGKQLRDNPKQYLKEFEAEKKQLFSEMN